MEEKREHTRQEIRRQLRRFLRNAREKEQLVLVGLAQAFCMANNVTPEMIELVSRREDGEAVFFFRVRKGALKLVGKGLV